MKKWYIGIGIIFIAALIAGQIGKMTFHDVGIADMESKEDIDKIDFGMYYIFGKDEQDEEFIHFSLTEYEEDYVNETLEAPIIVIGKPTGNYVQESISFGQEIIVEKILKGQGIEEGKKYYVYGTDGFMVDETSKPVYTNIKNILNEKFTYIIFLIPSELNQYNILPNVYCRQLRNPSQLNCG